MAQEQFWRHIRANEKIREQYARSKTAGLEILAEEIIDISDDGVNDTYLDNDGNERTDNDVIQRSKLRVDSRKWILSKLLPRKYGDKIEITNDNLDKLDTLLKNMKDKTEK